MPSRHKTSVLITPKNKTSVLITPKNKTSVLIMPKNKTSVLITNVSFDNAQAKNVDWFLLKCSIKPSTLEAVELLITVFSVQLIY